MLQRMTEGQTRMLAVADRLESLDSREFDMQDWAKCIAGHTLRVIDSSIDVQLLRILGQRGICMTARDYLGLDEAQGQHLFCPSYINSLVTPRLAASVLRNFVATGTINWGL